MSAPHPRRRDPEPPVVDGRVPPHDLDAEAAVLSACLLDRDALDEVVGALEPEHFYSEANKLIFEAVRSLAVEGSAVDSVTVSKWLRSREQILRVGGPAYIARITDATPAVANVEDHAEIIRDLWRTRRAIAIGHRYAALGYGATGSASLLDAFQAELAELSTSAHRGGLHPLKDVLTTTFRAISEAASRGEQVTGIPTRFVDLDKKTAGLHRGDLMVVAARPGMGKTAWALELATNVASPSQTPRTGDDGYTTEWVEKPGLGVAVFSLEMPKEQVAVRMACCEARVDLGKMRSGELSQEDWSALTNAAQRLVRLPIEIDDTAGITVMELRAKVRRLMARWDRERRTNPEAPELGCIVIDYLQLMQGRREKGDSRATEVGTITRDLKSLAKDLGVPVVALAQLNRGVETRPGKNKRPMLSDLRESGDVEQDADIVIFIYRDDYYNEASDQRGIAELIIAKQRNGPTGTVRVRFVRSCTRFENLAQGEFNEEESSEYE